jgi:hypothetical protein
MGANGNTEERYDMTEYDEDSGGSLKQGDKSKPETFTYALQKTKVFAKSIFQGGKYYLLLEY